MSVLDRTVPPRLGQGLLETTIAIGVIVTALFASFTLVLAHRRASEEAILRLGGVQAAREGIEVVRSIRDGNWLAGTRVWDDGIAGNGVDYTAVARFDGTSRWELAYGPNVIEGDGARIVRSVVGTDTFLTQDAAPSGSASTPYRRLIAVDPICAATDGTLETVTSGKSCAADRRKAGIRVRSTVRWTSRAGGHDVVAEETLFDWR